MYPLLNNLLSGVLGSIITLGLSSFFEYRNKKISSRSYIALDNISLSVLYGELQGLENASNQKTVRILCTKNYEEIEKSGRPKQNFIIIRNIGESLILECKIHICLQTQDGDKYEVEAEVPLLEKDQEVLICTDNIKYGYTIYYDVSTEIFYTTVFNEKIKVEFEKTQKGNDSYINKTISVKKLGLFIKKSKIKIPKCSWIYKKVGQ